MTVFNGKLYAACRAQANELIWSNFDGTTWSHLQVMIPGEVSTMGPSICPMFTTLIAVWKGMFGDQNLDWSQFNWAGSGKWSPKHIVYSGVGSSPDL